MVATLHRQIARLLIVILTMLPLYNLQAAGMTHADMANSVDTGMPAHAAACPMHDSDTLSAADADTLCDGMGCDICGACTLATLPTTHLTLSHISQHQAVALAEQLPQPLRASPFRPPRS